MVQNNSIPFPPRAEWDMPPWNRWSFLNICELLPTTEVWRGDGPAHIFPVGKSLPIDLAVLGINAEATTLEALLDNTFTDGFMVLKHGAIVCEHYFNGMDHRTLHLSQSVAKSLTGAVAGIVVGRGLLNVDMPITEYLPELSSTAWCGATLQQVLDMTTGVRFSEDYTDTNPTTRMMVELSSTSTWSSWV